MHDIKTRLNVHLGCCAMHNIYHNHPSTRPEDTIITDKKVLDEIMKGWTYYQLFESPESVELHLYSRRWCDKKTDGIPNRPFFSITIPVDAEVCKTTNRYGDDDVYVISWGKNKLILDNRNRQIFEYISGGVSVHVIDDSLFRIWK